MGNEYPISESGPLSFFEDLDAERYFSKVDYQLKDGMHFQDRDHQRYLFQFIKKHERSLSLYYQKYFEVSLSHGGEGTERYYFLEFFNADRGKIDGEHRKFLSPEFVIIGFLIYKIIFIDGNLELTSVKLLQTTLKTDYEELKKDINRLLAKLRKTAATTLTDKRIDEIVHDALKEFKKLGWVIYNEDYFDVLPSFSRLHKIYGEYINNLEAYAKNQQL